MPAASTSGESARPRRPHSRPRQPTPCRPGRAAGPPHPSRSGRRARLPSPPSWPGGRRSPRPQDGRQPLGGVQDAVVLHVAAGADHDGPEVGPQHHLAPDTRAGGHGHVADQDRGGATKAPGSTTGRRPANSISNAIRPQPSSLGWSVRRRASAVRTPWVPEAGCHAAYLYSWIRPPRTSRRRSRPKFGAFLASARSDGTGVAWAKLRCGRCWL
jgi:hypothetical protein